MTASPAPAAMPGVEDVARLLFERGRDVHDARSWEEANVEMREWLLGHAHAILALFAPILAEKERLGVAVIEAEERCAALEDAGKADWSKHGATEIALGQWKARALAAEAALAAIKAKHAEWRKCMPDCWEGDPLSHAIEAAAIRGQGE